MEEKIRELEAEIADLPSGYISRKNIRGKIQHYYQWTEAGKKRSKYVDDSYAEELTAAIEKRRALQNKLKEMKKNLPKAKPARQQEYFRTNVLTGDALKKFVEPVKALKRRDCYSVLEDFFEESQSGKLLILYGLRRTGKTTLMRQVIASFSDLQKTAFIQVSPGISLGDINSDLKLCSEKGYQNIFIDEATLAEDFIEGSALFSDIYAASGMKIVLSGTDSLGFLFAKSEELYDRCIMLHTTWIPYREFDRVLGITGIDEYIRFGGTMSIGGKHYNPTFYSKESTDEYIDSAIAKNIQHSLRFYQDGGHFRNLADLFDKNELTSAINRVIEDINHRFTVDVLTKDFISHDLGVSNGLRRVLEILNKNEQSIKITNAHRIEIKEYLDLLDLTVDIPTEFIPVRNEKAFKTAISQPGLRYSQAQALISQLLLDEEFQNISAVDRAWISERILNEIRGRMMEDIVLLETKISCPQKHVFRLQFAVGEFDMVVVDPAKITSEIYEIKHSTERTAEQYKNLVDSEKCSATEFRYGKIIRKAVIYRGENAVDGDIEYLNVEDYLKSV